MDPTRIDIYLKDVS